MNHYFLFHFQAILEALREKHQTDEENDKEINDKVLNRIGPKAEIEDMPFYRDYLAGFDVERAFYGYKLAAENGNSAATRDDLLMLFRFVVASFSSSYEILFDEETQSVDLSITVKSGGASLTKSIKELYTIQIIRLFEIYMNEQVELFALEYGDPEEYSEDAEEQQQMQQKIFERKVKEFLDNQE